MGAKKDKIIGAMLENAGLDPENFLGEAKYKTPQKYGDLDEPTVANFKKRAKCFADAVSFLEKAVDALGKCPKIDFMDDIPSYSHQIENIISAEGGEVGMKNLAKAYAKEGKKESEAMMARRQQRLDKKAKWDRIRGKK